MATRRAAASFAVVMLITSKICFFSLGGEGGGVRLHLKLNLPLLLLHCALEITYLFQKNIS